MVEKIIEKGLQWPAIVLQAIILSNIVLISVSANKFLNMFLLISAVIILSLFILNQSVGDSYYCTLLIKSWGLKPYQ